VVAVPRELRSGVRIPSAPLSDTSFRIYCVPSCPILVAVSGCARIASDPSWGHQAPLRRTIDRYVTKYRSPHEWRYVGKRKWELLKEKYEEEGLVLALGAGVSLGSKLPNWPKLLQILVEDSIGKGDPNYFKELKKWPLPVIASVLEQSSFEEQKDIEPRAEFIERVRKALYRKFHKDLYPDIYEALYLDSHKRVDSPLGPDMDSRYPLEKRKKAEENRRKLVRDVCAHNETLRTVAALCVVQYAGKEKQLFKANVEHIRAIVTFNLDNLLQEYTRARYNNPGLLRTIERATQSPSIGKISLYHMHGLLRFDSKAMRPEKEAADAVVLTEQNYFDFFNDPMSLFNYTFLYLLREFSCLFIGLSMQDENIRRLLHYSREERVKSYLRKHPRKPEDDAIEKSRRHFAILQRSDSSSINSAVEKSLLALGTRVLWVADYDEIPARLAEIYHPARYEWDQVY
jgi:hypothetical protein